MENHHDILGVNGEQILLHSRTFTLLAGGSDSDRTAVLATLEQPGPIIRVVVPAPEYFVSHKRRIREMVLLRLSGDVSTTIVFTTSDLPTSMADRDDRWVERGADGKLRFKDAVPPFRHGSNEVRPTD